MIKFGVSVEVWSIWWSLKVSLLHPKMKLMDVLHSYCITSSTVYYVVSDKLLISKTYIRSYQDISSNWWCRNTSIYFFYNSVFEGNPLLREVFNLYPPRLLLSFSCDLIWGLYPLPSFMVAWDLYPLFSSMLDCGLYPLLSSLFVRRLCPLLSCLFIRWLFPLTSCLFVSGLSLLPSFLVGFLAAWFKSFLVVSFVINSGILLIGVLTFLGGLIRLFSDFAMLVFLVLIFPVIFAAFFPVILSVVFSGLLIVDWLFYKHILRVLNSIMFLSLWSGALMNITSFRICADIW